MMNKRYARCVAELFLGFILLFFAANLIMPDSDFSQQENRYLQTLPSFSFKRLTEGKFTREFEDYCSDQFVLRDAWTTLKARCELLSGKRANNGIYLCEGGRLIEPFSAPSPSEVEKRVKIIDRFAQSVSVPVTLGLIPSGSEIYGDLLPQGAPNASQQAVIDDITSSVELPCADISAALSEHREEYIFYRTDHHWTSLGAFYGYTALCRAWGLPEPALSAYAPVTVSDAFYGTTYSSSGFSWVAPDAIERFVEADKAAQVINYNTGSPLPGSLYAEEKLSVKDKYAYFLGGNSALQVVYGWDASLPSLLILRDSYSDALTPFLLENFSEIHLLDLRYYSYPAADYVAENNIDQVLILYSVSNFVSDSRFMLLAS